MKKLASLMLLSALLLTGCVGMPGFTLTTETTFPPTNSPEQAERETPRPPAVLPEQVRPETAGAVLDALKAEVEYDMRKK